MNVNLRPSALRTSPKFSVGAATSAADVTAALELRYRVFAQELGASGHSVDHFKQQERDKFDDSATHLVLKDHNLPTDNQVVGSYRLLTQEAAVTLGGFYTEAEFDLSALKSSGRRILELGRSCIAPAYRGSAALLHLWQGIGQFVAAQQVEVLFGTASFRGADVSAHYDALALLHQDYGAPPALAATALGGHYAVDAFKGPFDKQAALRGLPPLIKSYLRMGGRVGQGVYCDTAFDTTDVCMIVDVDALSPQQNRLYGHSTA